MSKDYKQYSKAKNDYAYVDTKKKILVALVNPEDFDKKDKMRVQIVASNDPSIHKSGESAFSNKKDLKVATKEDHKRFRVAFGESVDPKQKLNEHLVSIRTEKEVLEESQVAKTIQQQIGNKTFFMLGAKSLVAGKDYLSFRIGRNSKSVNMIKVTLNAKDLYDVEYLSVRGVNIKVKSKDEDIYVDMLHKSIETNTGMYTSL